jgi:hypothetical protein
VSPARLIEHGAGIFGPELELVNDCWRLRVGLGERLDPYELYDLRAGRYVADESYCYQLAVSPLGEPGYSRGTVPCQGVRPVDWALEESPEAATLVLVGHLDFGPEGPTNIRLEHRIALSGPSVREELSLFHHHGRDSHRLSKLRFGFRKTLFDRSSFSWRPGCGSGELVPVPLRRRAGQGTDHYLAGYAAADLYPQEWTSRGGLPHRSAEAWLWCEPGSGFLVAKYNQDHIEFSVADGELVVPRRAPAGGAELQLDLLHSDRDLCLRFGGAGVSRGCPESARQLRAGERLGFGPSIIEPFDGDWQAGFGAYKKLLRARGHVVPAGYAPRVHWNELYRLGWRCGSNAPLQELPQLWEEAARARAMGAQAFYFDPGWDLFEGSSVWDVDRLGPAEDFARRLRDEYGLSLALHVMVHTKSLDEDPAIYRRRRDGEIDLWKDATPYVGGYVCPASPVWQHQKTERLRKVCASGASFLMFDFLAYEHGGVEPFDHEAKELETCWSPEHGHSVPLTREEHAEAIMEVIRAIKREFPEVKIEAHDRVAGEFLPLYYQHGPSEAHDELWGFEYMWDPYTDLLSGKALSLYEYNLAYDIPLYLHINSAHDSKNLLAFWWYASCCRHLGIGGLDQQGDQWPYLAAAMKTYRRLQAYFSRGRFCGIDPLTHLHVLDDEGGAVLTAFNLGPEHVSRTVAITAEMMPIGPAPRLAGATSDTVDGALIVNLEIGALSPAVVEIDV